MAPASWEQLESELGRETRRQEKSPKLPAIGYAGGVQGQRPDRSTEKKAAHKLVKEARHGEEGGVLHLANNRVDQKQQADSADKGTTVTLSSRAAEKNWGGRSRMYL